MSPARIRIRIRIWWLMVAVAAFALMTRGCIWAEEMEWSSAYYRNQADLHASLARQCREIADASGRPTSRAGRLAAYHDRLRQTYARASAHPWLDVPPDPPPPE